jgi:anti-sigma regulatory factor (Ser/Thr protein kinase)
MSDEQLDMFTSAHSRRLRTRTGEIRGFLLRNVASHPRTLAGLAADQFGVSRRAINRHLRALVGEGLLEARGHTRAREYYLRPLDAFSLPLQVSPKLEEDRVWTNEIGPHLAGVRENVVGVCHYGFTEMLNNVIDHSTSERASITFERDPVAILLIVRDFGIGIFRKIATELNLEDEHQAILEIAKGKVTTDPERHTGEGIFFTSRMFDYFAIASGSLHFGSHDAHDWLLEPYADRPIEGTLVFMRIDVDSRVTTREIFDRFTADFEDYGFTKTHIPVDLFRHEGERLVSRSQAKRLLTRVDRFTEVVLDFEGVEAVGQAFADQIFRVFVRQHPGVNITPINASAEVLRMIARAQSAPNHTR